jgi:phosphatidylglycerophosphate synthase
MLTQAIHTKLQDPLNRLYRGRVARALANAVQNTGLTPNMVTIFHTIVGVVGSVLIYRQHYLLAVLCFEARAILDCMDGILARMKNQSTAIGRTLDAIGDGITFNSLMIAGTLRLIQDFQFYPHPLIVLGVMVFAFVAVHCGVVYQLMRRKLTSVANREVDIVESEWRDIYEQVKGPKPSTLIMFSFWIDSMTIKFVSEEWYDKVMKRKDLSNWKEKAIQEAEILHELACRTRKVEFRRAVRAASLVSDDNVFSLMSLSFAVFGIFHTAILPFVHPVLIAFSIGFIYSVVALGLGLHFYHEFLHGVYRE